MAPATSAVVHRPLRAAQQQRADAGHELGAVVQRQPLLGLQPQGLQPRPPQRLAPGQDLAAHLRLPFAHQHQRQVRQRRQVAGRAHGALLGDHGVDAVVQQVQQPLHDHRAHAGKALGQHVGAQQGHGARLRPRQGRAHAARVAADEVDLQLLQPVGGDGRLRQPPEARRHAVDGGALRPARAPRRPASGGCAPPRPPPARRACPGPWRRAPRPPA